MNYVLVFVGGGLGSLTRYAVNLLWPGSLTTFPFATLVSNSASCFILGLLLSYMFAKEQSNSSLILFLATGFCGGFSTFSTFTYETFQLLNSGNYKIAFANVLLSLIVCYVSIVAGFFTGRLL